VKKTCSVYFRGDDIYVIASSKTTAGLWIDTEPRFKLTRPVSASHLGRTVISALNGSREGVPTPDDLRSVGKELLHFVGFKSLSSFERGAIYFLVTLEENAINIIPTSRGTRGGFDFHASEAVYSNVNPDELGETLMKLALERQGR